MKKALLIASAVAATSLFAVESNEIAVKTIEPPKASNLMLLTVPFNGYGAGDSAEINVADVLSRDGLSVGDKLYIPTATKGAYNQYTLAAGGWTADKVVTVSGTTKTAGSADSPAEAVIARGSAFWLETAATSVRLLGQATANQDKTAKSVSAGYQLLAPTTSEGDIQVNTLGGSTGDLILLADGTRYQKTASGWKNVATRAALGDSVKIPAGVGFWYKAAAAASLGDL